MKKRRGGDLIAYILLTIGVVLVVSPLVYMFTTSLRPNGVLFEYPPRFFPSMEDITLENYVYIVTNLHFYRNMLNSLVVAVCTVAAAAFVASSLAYCIARFKFRGRNALFALIMATMIVPGLALILPQFQLASLFGFIDKTLGLIPFYTAWVVPFSTFMIKGFMEDIPKDFDDAVYIDGGSVFTVYFRIMLPLSAPALGAVSVFNFLTSWEEYGWAMTVLNDNIKRTLPIAIAGFFGRHNFTQWGYVFAMSVVSLVPVLIVYGLCQRFFVSGLSAGAIKG
jgi:multiple sugar transport system permease protein